MTTQWWIILAVGAVIAAVLVYRSYLETRDRRDQNRRIDVQAAGQARSADAEITQREDRRLAGMTAEDKEWEQASLQRHRESQAHAPQAEIPAENKAHR